MDKRSLLGEKIKEIRKKFKLTQEKFSERIGIEPPSLSNIENGKSYPSMVTVFKVMEEFKVSPDDFFNFEYLKSDKDLENEIFMIIKKMSHDKKQILYRIIKQFDI